MVKQHARTEKQALLKRNAQFMQRTAVQPRHVGRNIVIAISLLVLGFVCFNVAINTASHITALDNVAFARQYAISSADRQFAAQVTALRQEGLIGTQLARSKVDVCYTDHQDQGWFAASWYQNCYLRYIAGFIANQHKTTVLNKLSALETLLGKPRSTLYEQQVSPCDLAEINYLESVRYRTAGSDIKESDECGIPDPIQGVFVGPDPPLESNDQLGVKKFYSYVAAKVDNSHDQLWVIYNDFYYHEELGCGIGIFCKNPRVRPVQAP